MMWWKALIAVAVVVLLLREECFAGNCSKKNITSEDFKERTQSFWELQSTEWNASLELIETLRNATCSKLEEHDPETVCFKPVCLKQQQVRHKTNNSRKKGSSHKTTLDTCRYLLQLHKLNMTLQAVVEAESSVTSSWPGTPLDESLLKNVEKFQQTNIRRNLESAQGHLRCIAAFGRRPRSGKDARRRGQRKTFASKCLAAYDVMVKLDGGRRQQQKDVSIDTFLRRRTKIARRLSCAAERTVRLIERQVAASGSRRQAASD